MAEVEVVGLIEVDISVLALPVDGNMIFVCLR